MASVAETGQFRQERLSENMVIPEPLQYSPELFVGRGRELAAVERLVAEGVENRPITQSFVHFGGLPTSGSSWLLLEIEEKYRYSAGEAEARHDKKPLAMYLDLEPDRVYTMDDDSRQAFCAKVIGKIEKQLGEDAAEILGGLDLGEGNPEEILPKLIGRLTAQTVPIFLFDHHHSLDETDLAWLEDTFVMPFARQDKIIYVTEGRRCSPWKDFEARRRQDYYPLSSFDEYESREMLLKQGVDDGQVQDVVYDLAGGQPYATQVFGAVLTELAREEEIEGSAGLYQRHPEVVERVYEQLLERIVDRGELDRQELAVLATLRNWGGGVVAVRHVLSFGLGEECRDYSDLYFLGKSNSFAEDGICRWETTARGYVMDPSLRYLLQKRLELTDPARLADLHRVAAVYYGQFVEQGFPQQEVVGEYYYHQLRRASLLVEPEQSQVIRAVCRQLQAVFADQLDRVAGFEAIRGQDNELKQLERKLKIDNPLARDPFAIATSIG